MITNKVMPCDDACSQASPMAVGLANRISPDSVALWSLLRTGQNLTNWHYEIGRRTITPSCATVVADFVDGALSLMVDPTEAMRVVPGHILLLETGEQVTVENVDIASGTVTLSSRGIFADPAIIAPFPTTTSGSTVCITGTAQGMCEVKGASRYESTEIFTNYVQKSAERLEWCYDDRCVTRKFGVNEALMVQERMTRMLKEINRGLYHNSPRPWCKDDGFSLGNAGQFGITAGIDSVIYNCGKHVIQSSTPGQFVMQDLFNLMEELIEEGVTSIDRPTIMVNSSVALQIKKAFRDHIQQYEDEYICSVEAICWLGLVLPIVVDNDICDSNVRIISLAHGSKHFFCPSAGSSIATPNLRIVDEISESTSECLVQYVKMKFGTMWQNTCAHGMIVTGLGSNACRTPGCDCGGLGKAVDCATRGTFV